MAMLKKCSKTGCNKILNDGIIYCDKHQGEWEQIQKKRYREYSKRRREDKEQKKYQDFYNSDEWKRIREVVISDCYGVDILEYYRTGKVIQGERVHHIIELNEDWNCRLDLSNLIYLTESNHRQVHEIYKRSDKDKRKMQKILFELIGKFVDEFGI